MKQNKILLNLPFNYQRAISKQPLKRNIEIGVDLGLKDFAVLSVMDKSSLSSPKEIARYFLDQKTLFGKKFNANTGKFLAQSSSTNIKLTLIRLRREVRNIQRLLKGYENRSIYRGVTNYQAKMKYRRYSKTLQNLWAKVKNINLEIVRQLNHTIIAIAKYHGASKLIFEDLRWSKIGKKQEVGHFISYWSVQWFYSQVQAAVEHQSEYWGISFIRVDPRFTSKRCSECSELKFATRDGKQFVCTNISKHKNKKEVRLDSDLNAARNIALAST